jgi:hypothetical protein
MVTLLRRCIALAVLLAAASPAAAQNTISGSVTNRNTGVAMEGVNVRIEGGGRTLSRLTDATGHYLFVDLPDGVYLASASFGSGRCAPRSIRFTLGGSTRSETGNFGCLSTGQRLRINGWTRDAVSGAGIPGAEIRVCCFEGIGEQRVLSGADGNFVIHNLRDETYTLTPSHPDYQFERDSLRIPMNGWNKHAQFPAYARTYALSGKVIDITTGSDLSNAMITIVDDAYLQDPTTDGRWFRRSDREGLFSFDHVRNGRYTLTASLRGYVFDEESQVIEIRSEGQFLVLGARPERRGGFNVLWGLIRDEQGRGVEGALVRIERCFPPREGRTPEERCPELLPPEPVLTGVTGIWRRELNPGIYRVTPTSPTYEFLPNLYYATLEGADVMVDFQARQFAPRPEDLARYTISGKVTSDCPNTWDDVVRGLEAGPDCSPKTRHPFPVPRVTLELTYCGGPHAGYLGNEIDNEHYRPICLGHRGESRTVRTGSNGRYRFGDVAPGVYHLKPLDWGGALSAAEYLQDSALWYDPDGYYLRLSVRDLEGLNFRSRLGDDPRFGVIEQAARPEAPPEERSARSRIQPGATRPPRPGAIERRSPARQFGAEESYATGEAAPQTPTQRNLDRAVERARERRAALERREKPAAFPDLQVLSLRISGSSRPAPNERLTLVATVKNAGRRTASPTKLTSRRSLDRTVSASDPRGSWVSVRSLRAGESATLHLTLTAPKQPGRVYLAVCAEPAKSERHTSNNCSEAIPVTIVSRTRATPKGGTTPGPVEYKVIPEGRGLQQEFPEIRPPKK